MDSEVYKRYAGGIKVGNVRYDHVDAIEKMGQQREKGQI